MCVCPSCCCLFFWATKRKHDHFQSSCCLNAKLSCLFVNLNSFWWLLLRLVFILSFAENVKQNETKFKRIKSFTFIVISLPNFAVWLIANCALVRCIMIKCFFFVYVREFTHTRVRISCGLCFQNDDVVFWPSLVIYLSCLCFGLSFAICCFFVFCQREKETLFYPLETLVESIFGSF